MQIDQQIDFLEQLIELWKEDEDCYRLKEVLASLCRLRQIDRTATAPSTGTLASGRSLYTEALDLYDKWHKEQLGVRMRMSSAEGKALKAILRYLTESCEGDELMALNTWSLILANWSVLNDFLKAQTSLVQINKYIIEIIVKIKAHAANSKASPVRARNIDDLISQGRS